MTDPCPPARPAPFYREPPELELDLDWDEHEAVTRPSRVPIDSLRESEEERDERRSDRA